MEKQAKSIHLFNCDKTFNLDSVKLLLTAMTGKLDFDLSIEKHYFYLSKMSEMSNSTIPSLKMDFAVFVVHAHESRLSINEDNAGIGFAEIYRALLQATDDNVIIVIGGDDNYKDEDEENKAVLSRWAWKKISSQFRGEYLDGRKSFVFSWDEKHREVHEEALLHYFDQNKKGEKFEPKPKEKVEFANEQEKEPSYESPNSAEVDAINQDQAEDETGGAEASTVSTAESQYTSTPKADASIVAQGSQDVITRVDVIPPWWQFWRRYPCTIL